MGNDFLLSERKIIKLLMFVSGFGYFLCLTSVLLRSEEEYFCTLYMVQCNIEGFAGPSWFTKNA